jgi:tetratricopeptide (TPR) repeat protein
MTRAGRRAPGAWLLALAGLAGSLVILDAAPVRGLTDPRGIVRALDLAYDADFAGAEAEVGHACGPAPKPACEVAKAVIQWWRIFLDVENRSRDRALVPQVEWAITQTEQWTTREPERAEAWLYLGAAYGVRSQFHVWRRDFLPAVRDGKRIKASLERALALDPSLHDAHFGIGLYRYYADLAPAILKLLRWIFFLPGGNRAEGMQQMLQTRDSGTLMRTEAAYQIYQADIWYESKIDHARALLEELRARHPHNPLFLLNLAQLHEVYRNDRPAAREAYQALIDGARSGAIREPALANAWGRRGVAAQLDTLGETDRAVEMLQALVASKPAAPYGVIAAAGLDLGRAYDRLGRRDEAVAAYRAALASPIPDGDPDGVRTRAKDALRQAPDKARADAWRLSLDGWRAHERGDDVGAAAALERAVQLAPLDGVAWYRRGVVHEAQGDRARALAAFERAAQVRPSAPPPFVANALVGAARVYAANGDRGHALSALESALKVRGADPATRAAAEQARAALKRP